MLKKILVLHFARIINCDIITGDDSDMSVQ